MVIKVSVQSITVGFSRYNTVDSMRLTLGNPFNTMKRFLSLQPMFSPTTTIINS